MKNKPLIQLLTSLSIYAIIMFGLGCDEKTLNNLMDIQSSLTSTISLLIPGL
ncbi:hypothetical protein C7460_11193 [Marinoscillum furvescens DSM 4134]|uniref:Uncharacterized protein n=1 Tax=Marinoscillum furvescens DSM 4134 TaxID=1122208 RepID=A0A3D9L215_MARFU|nr:hypothetical protein C7460_11193 [Marinoscillum furvescens DSM 4134]